MDGWRPGCLVGAAQEATSKRVAAQKMAADEKTTGGQRGDTHIGRGGQGQGMGQGKSIIETSGHSLRLRFGASPQGPRGGGRVHTHVKGAHAHVA